MDKLNPKRRSENMRRIRSKNTKPEVLLRSFLHKVGYRFRLHRKDLPGKPDIVFAGPPQSDLRSWMLLASAFRLPGGPLP